MCKCVHGIKPNFRTKLEVSSIWKNELELEPKGLKFEKTQFKPPFEEPPNKIYKVKTRIKSLFLKEELHNTSTNQCCVIFIFKKNSRSDPFHLKHFFKYMRKVLDFFWIYHNLLLMFLPQPWGFSRIRV